jgi:hypothetical protein
MNLVKIGNAYYNLHYLVKYVEHVGQSEVGTIDEDPLGPRPAFDDFRYYELFFLDGRQVTLDEAQTEAFRRFVTAKGSTLDLDQVDEDTLGHVLVRDTESGDVIVSPETLERDEDATPARPHRLPSPLGGPAGGFGPGVESITQDGM